MKNLQVYRYVDAVDRYGSIRKAAEQLAITPSALNRRVLALEDELGVPIFERLGRGVRLSAAGELVVHVFRRQLAEIEQVKSKIRAKFYKLREVFFEIESKGSTIIYQK